MTAIRIAAVAAGFAALAVVAGPFDEAQARQAKKSQKQAKAQARQSAGDSASARADGYVVRDADKLPFGSALWWDQMMREDRAGRCCN
jgi:hypothetical protein